MVLGSAIRADAGARANIPERLIQRFEENRPIIAVEPHLVDRLAVALTCRLGVRPIVFALVGAGEDEGCWQLWLRGDDGDAGVGAPSAVKILLQPPSRASGTIWAHWAVAGRADVDSIAPGFAGRGVTSAGQPVGLPGRPEEREAVPPTLLEDWFAVADAVGLGVHAVVAGVVGARESEGHGAVITEEACLAVITAAAKELVTSIAGAGIAVIRVAAAGTVHGADRRRARIDR